MATQEHPKGPSTVADASQHTSGLHPHSAIICHHHSPPPWAGNLRPDFLRRGAALLTKPRCLWMLEDAETFPVSRLPPDAGVTEALKPKIREKTGGGRQEPYIRGLS